MLNREGIIENLESYIPLKADTKFLVNDFLGKLESLGFKYFFIQNSLFLYYKEIGICRIKFLDKEVLKVHLEKIKKSKSPLIQEHFSYFNEYWTEHLKDSIHNIEVENEREFLLFKLEILVEIFFKDLTVNFRLNEIKFTNYRSFIDEELKFNEKVTVLIGRNSSGKTSILDAAAVAIGAFLSGIDEPTDSKTIAKEDVRFSAKEVEGVRVVNHHVPTKIIFNTDFINNRYTWSRTRNSLNSTKLTTKDSSKIVSLVRFLVNEVRNNESRNISLPVFSYHGTGRVANFTKDMKLLEKTENISRFVGYKDCLKPASNYKFFIAWYSKMQYRSFTLSRRIPTLDAVTECLEKSLTFLTVEEDLKVKRVLFLEGALHIEYTNSEIMPISYLSDGYQDIIGVISDIAYRMAILNPHLGKNVLEETTGIVLIDEIDVHLHPRWQQKILSLLKELFPKVQFIATTHSPIIVSTTEKDETQELFLEENTNRKMIKTIGEPNEWFISDILKNVFDLNQDSLIRNKPNGEMSLGDELELFSKLVKEYLVHRDSQKVDAIFSLYNSLEKKLQINSPQRRAIDSLKRLIE